MSRGRKGFDLEEQVKGRIEERVGFGVRNKLGTIAQLAHRGYAPHRGYHG